MNDIFQGNIYPHEGKIKAHFKDFYDQVFIAFLPFFKVDRQVNDSTNMKKSEQISLRQAEEKMDVLKAIQSTNSKVFSYSNNDYPANGEIYNSGEIISWNKIVTGSELADFVELNIALKTSIGALRNSYARPELTEKLNNYTTSQKIWHPNEGSFDTLSKIAIYKTFQQFGKNQIIVTDEFYRTTSTLDLDKLTDFEFSEKVSYADYYLYSSDKEILFTIEWDSFFYLIATHNDKMKLILESNLFEGFLCDDKTEHGWYYAEDELQLLPDSVVKEDIMKAKKKNQWWKFWN